MALLEKPLVVFMYYGLIFYTTFSVTNYKNKKKMGKKIIKNCPQEN